MIQDASRARWRRLAERYPVEVTLLVPSHWESGDFANSLAWNPQPICEGHFQVKPLPVTNVRAGTSYLFKSWDAGLRQLQPDIIYVVQEESAHVLQQIIVYRRLWAPRSRLLFFSWNNLGIAMQHGHYPRRWRRVCASTDMAIAGNSEVKKVLENAGYRKPILVQTEVGVDESVFKPDAEARTRLRSQLGLHGFVIGYAGRIIAMKGLRDLIGALARLQGNWSLLLVGDGDLRAEIVSRAQDESWNVHCTGYVAIDEMPGYYPAMDCLVLPSRTTTRWKEQFGLVLAQTMACRVPVIGSSSGAIPEVIGDAGLIFPEGDVEALHDCLKRLMEDEALRYNLAQRGYERAMAKYSAGGLAEETYNMFRKLLIVNSNDDLD